MPDKHDDYIDIRQDLINESSVFYGLPGSRVPIRQWKINNDQLHQLVLDSARVRQRITDVAAETGASRWELRQRSKVILNDLAQNFSLPTVRAAAGLVKYACEQLFAQILVNKEGLSGFQAAIEADERIVLLPTHRSYLDFILLSFVCFHHSIPLPTIAAASDFKGMGVFAKLLSRLGAFFVSRGASNPDPLYWSVFIEYVQGLIRHSGAPMEFFPEGTRSRTGKSIHPRYGLLSMVAELVASGQLQDITLIPVSITYEKGIEVNLYSYEMLGFKKPPESTSGLVKSLSILQNDYGRVWVHFGKRVSLRGAMVEVGIPRGIPSNNNRKPLHYFEWSNENIQKLKHVSLELSIIQRENLVVTVWPLLCGILGGQFEMTASPAVSISTDAMLDTLNCLRQLCHIPIMPSDKLLMEIKKEARLHEDFMQISPLDDPDTIMVTMKPIAESASFEGVRHALRNDTLATSLAWIKLQSFTNQSLFWLHRSSLILLLLRHSSIDGLWSISVENLRSHFITLERLFHRDFVPLPSHSESEFMTTLDRLTELGLLNAKADMVEISMPKSETVQLNAVSALISLMRPFLCGYYYAFKTLVQVFPDGEIFDEKVFLDLVHYELDLVQNSNTEGFDYRALSVDLLKNALHSLVSLNVVQKRVQSVEDGSSSSIQYSVEDHPALHRLCSLLSGLIRCSNSLAKCRAKL